MRGYYLATNLLAFVATLVLVAATIWGPMPWWIAAGGALAVNMIAGSYTHNETHPTDKETPSS